MLDAKKLKKRSVKSTEITFQTNKPASTGDTPDPYKPFKGKDGKTYLIAYRDSLNKSTNCYAFAMGWQIASNAKFVDYVPGFLSGKEFSYENIIDIIKADLKVVGREVYEVIKDIPKELPEGKGYWIKVLIPQNNSTDIHFMRKDIKSGRWLQKLGWEMPPKLVVRNTEFKRTIDSVLEMPQFEGFSKEMMETLFKSPELSEYSDTYFVEKCCVEEDDSADYISLVDGKEIVTFKAVWAMRISEPVY